MNTSARGENHQDLDDTEVEHVVEVSERSGRYAILYRFTRTPRPWLIAPMCRLFGFRSNVPSRTHRSLLEAENSVSRQAQRHKDGWGIGYFLGQDALRAPRGLLRRGR